jgi:Reeler domain-containing protein
MRIVILAALFLMSLPLVSGAFKEGPSPNVTGGFGEHTCQQCHFDNPLNAPGGSLRLTGIPASYVPGRTYPVTIVLSRIGLQRSGFEVSARFATGVRKGKQAGTWHTVDARVQLISGETDPGVTFVQHNLTGSRANTRGTNSWTVNWTAPSGDAPVQFNVAANASNDDDSPLGDYIYLKVVRSAPPKRASAAVASGTRNAKAAAKNTTP